MRVWGFIVGLLLFMPGAQAQVMVQGRFHADSIRVGEVVAYSLAASYPEKEQVLFPDSTFSFAPFEYAGRKYKATRTSAGVSYDSVIYYLTTFEVDKVQRLALPMFMVHPADCVVYRSPPDSLYLASSIPAALDSVSAQKLPLKSDTSYQPVSWLFNYPILVIAIGILLVLILTGWILFGKRIRRYFALRRLQKAFEEFLARFSEPVRSLSGGFDRKVAESALLIWKGYMENLERFPYTKSTSREILRNTSDPALGKALQTIDRGIYGGISAPVDAFRELENYSRSRFLKMEEKVKHG